MIAIQTVATMGDCVVSHGNGAYTQDSYNYLLCPDPFTLFSQYTQ